MDRNELFNNALHSQLEGETPGEPREWKEPAREPIRSFATRVYTHPYIATQDLGLGLGLISTEVTRHAPTITNY